MKLAEKLVQQRLKSILKIDTTGRLSASLVARVAFEPLNKFKGLPVYRVIFRVPHSIKG